MRMITRGATSGLAIMGEEEAKEDGDEDEDKDGERKEENALSKSQKDSVLEQEYRMRRMLFEYIMTDFISRYG